MYIQLKMKILVVRFYGNIENVGWKFGKNISEMKNHQKLIELLRKTAKNDKFTYE